MSIYEIWIKHDKIHRKYRKLSVTMKEPMFSVASLYADQWAIDNNQNRDLIAVKIVNSDTRSEFIMCSKATFRIES
jgi:hypothetical protein